MKSASCVPGHVSHFIDFFKLSCYCLYKGYHLVGGRRPTYALGKHLGVRTSSVPNLHWPGVPRSTVFSFSLAGYDDPNESTQCTFIWVMLYRCILLLFFPHGDFPHGLVRATGGC